MAMSLQRTDREYDKFVETVGGDTAVRVAQFGGFAVPIGADAVTAEYPSSLVEVYKFRTGGVSGTILMTVTITYTDVTKEFIQSAVKT